MKKYIYFIFLLFSAMAAKAQKPQFLIVAERSGDYIGEIKVELFPTIAPLHVANFSNLVADKFYDSTAFHRVIPGFMIQGGDPNSRSGPKNTWGIGNPSQPTVNAEFSAVSHQRGILSAARKADINSATSQFFICVAPAAHLDENYSIYGRVYEGMDIVDNIVASPRDANDNPLEKIEMFISYIGENTDIPAAPNLLSPANNTQDIISTSRTLSWSSVPGALLYSVEVSVMPDFSTLFFKKSLRTTSVSVQGLEGSTTYYWRVIANNGGYVSETSNVFNFSTKMYVGIEEVNNSPFILCQNIPNPFNSNTTIKYRLSIAGTITLKIFDLIGNEIAILEEGNKEQGEHEIVFDGSGLPNGIYYYQLETGNRKEMKKMAIFR
jgi:cyclophilin family peptidyl-prolyl cis-trans isomerase